MTDYEQQCTGWPEHHTCMVVVPQGTIYCAGCRLERQRAIVAGLPGHGSIRVGIILEDFDAPTPICRCGGDPTAIRHTQSLGHMEWSFRLQSKELPKGALQTAANGAGLSNAVPRSDRRR